MSDGLSTRPRSAAGTVLLVFVVAVFVNLPWELGQVGLGLFAGVSSRNMLFCATCSLGDGVLLLIILGAGRIVFGSLDWFVQPGVAGYVLMVTVGAALAVAVEWVALNAGRWQYEPTMPLLLGVRVGLLPVLQMTLLPPLIFRVVALLAFRKGQMRL